MKPLVQIRTWVKIRSKKKGEHYFPKYLGTFNLSRRRRFHRNTGKEYPQLFVDTEKEFVTFLRDNFGYGYYTVTAYLKGKKGGFIFWKGEITPDYWVFYNQSQYDDYDKKEMDNIDRQINQVQDQDEVNLLQDMKEDIVKEAKNKQKKRYGFTPYLNSSGKRGEYHYWEDPDEAKESIVSDEVKGEEIPETELPEPLEDDPNKSQSKDFDRMSLDDINNF